MNISSPRTTQGSAFGYFATMALAVSFGTASQAQQAPRFPAIKVQSPLLAIAPPAKPDDKEKANAEAGKPQAPAAEAAKPEMRVPPDADNNLLPKKAGQAVALEPDGNLDLKKLAAEAQAAPAAKQVSISRDSIIIHSLAGITLFKDDRKNPTDVPSSIPSSLAPGVNIASDLSTPDREELVQILQQKFLGKPVSFNGLDQIVKEILKFYSSKKRPMTHVYIPEQEITNKVKIAVLEGRLGDIRFAGDQSKRRWYQAALPGVPRALSAQQGDILDMNTISASVSSLNLSPWSRLGRTEAHPYHRSTLAMTPGSQLGYTDVELDVTSRVAVPIQGFAGWDNTGTVALGENRFNLGAVWYDAFNTGYNHQLGVQFQAAENYDLFHSVTGSYTIPIQRWNQSLQFFAAYMESTVNIPTAGVSQFVKGDAFIAGMRHYIKLPSLFSKAAREADNKAHKFAIYHDFGLGFDYKSQNNNLFFGGVNVFPSKIDVMQFVAEYNLRQTDFMGETNLNLSYYYSPGQLSRYNTDKAFISARSGGTADYSYARGVLSRMLELGVFSSYLDDFKLMVRATGQVSSANLVASEQLGLGGNASVRGYAERSLRSDQGLFIQTELYMPALHPLQFLAKKTPDRWTDPMDRTDELRFLVFYDYGIGRNVDPTVAEPGKHLNMSSLGLGLRYRYNKSMTFRCDYGYQLERLDPALTNISNLTPKYSNNGHGYLHMGLSLSF
ncbi:ShlB/FhaC/HecB family hemolysin secretion/activation protein [Prosthecobacter sp.]|uniref:ShlB/FhaC/HecB family hemolysin secretion/activation protein n=1 Tax=Prosthecobacter sp. TaxID=1965333 RepID=UPI0037852CED